VSRYDRNLKCSHCGKSYVGFHRRKFCSLECCLDSGIEVRGPNECWPWKKGAYSDGYGKVSFERETFQTHRLAYRLKVGPIPNGMVVMHSCDNPVCANYKNHLSIGTPADNTRDASNKFRLSSGERHHSAKLTPEIVKQIRRRARAGESYSSLAKEFGCSDVSLQRAAVGRTWRTVAEDSCNF
jgi:hypothetical protein